MLKRSRLVCRDFASQDHIQMHYHIMRLTSENAKRLPKRLHFPREMQLMTEKKICVEYLQSKESKRSAEHHMLSLRLEGRSRTSELSW
jgi:hypothetical protein